MAQRLAQRAAPRVPREPDVPADQAAAPGRLLTHVGHGLREGGLILALALAAWLLLALGSFAPDDPGFSHTGTREGVANLAGASGAWAGDVLYLLLGGFAYLLPVAFAMLALRLFWSRRLPVAVDRLTVALRLSGFLLTLVSGCVLVDMHVTVGVESLPAGPGGVLGWWLAEGTHATLGVMGGTLLMLAVFLLGITLFTGLSWIALAEAIGRGVVGGFMGLRARLAARIAARREQARVRKDQLRRRKQVQQEVVRKQAKPKVPVQKPVARIEPAAREQRERQQKLFDQPLVGELPPLELLDATGSHERRTVDEEALGKISDKLERKLKDFGVVAEVVGVYPGPVITRYEIQPAAGVKVSRISGLAKDLARSLAVISVRVVEVIPGKSTVGIEIPNEDREIVRLRDVLSSKEYDSSSSHLTLALGMDIAGKPIVVDLARMPHLLVAGTTGSGKSVGVNAMLLSLLFKANPDEVRLIMVDPKMLELSVYEGIPHLLTPVVTDMKQAASALRWCVAEMERRYKLLAGLGVRNLAGYNRKVRDAEKAGRPIGDPLWKPPALFEGDEPPTAPPLETMPQIVVVIDEFADMIMIVGKKVEELIARIAQKARAAGIHLILATQRPSVDVITGLIKANIPTRISFQVSSKIDSRTILDQGGAEQLLGHGDMLYLPPGTAVPVRVHGAFVEDDEVHRVVSDWRRRGEPDYLPEVLEGPVDFEGSGGGGTGDTEQDDPLYDEAVALVLESRRASISAVQRKLRIGYNRAARMIEAMEAAGVVSSMDGSGGREVLAPGREE